MKTIRILMTLVLLTALLAANARGQGLLIPKDESIPPLAIKHQRVDVRVTDGVAAVKIEQVFRNGTDRDLEAIYVFPLPEGAAISDFGMYINGKRISGEVVEKGKARKIYEDIVRRMRDPGLLEHMGDNLFRVSVYPVPKNGEQKFEIEYSQQLAFEAGLYKLVYPLKTGQQSSRLLEDFTIGVRLSSKVPLKTIYSPSHQVGITRKGENEAVIGFEENRSLLDKDFVLYYGISQKQFGLNLLTHATQGQDGYFMMMIAPAVEPPGGKPLPKDVTFVFDSSGSMSGGKIEQARKALQYCIGRLNDADRFNVVRFSTDVETFKSALVEATPANREAAVKFVETMEARGGTAIHDALLTALATAPDPQRPAFVVFLTDGQPTIGETDPDVIAKAVGGKNAAGVRLFVFGVGDEVNSRLLDRLASGNGGQPAYVKPGEDIEVKVSTLADKISQPVLGKPVVTIDKLATRHIHPKELPDLFAGEQVTLVGRYQGDGHVAVRLTGLVNGKKQEFVYEQTFPASNADNTFIPRLWATRRVGYLLEEIRLRGASQELQDEVIQLGKEYGIMTPYTSYLVLENDKSYEEHGIPRSSLSAPGKDKELGDRRERAAEQKLQAFGRGAGGSGNRPGGESSDLSYSAATPALEADALGAVDAVRTRSLGKKSGAEREVRQPAATPAVIAPSEKPESVARRIASSEGASSISMSEAIQEYKRADSPTDESSRVQRVEGRTFYLIDGVWADSAYRAGGTEQKVRFASPEYFTLLEEKPALKPFFALGERVIVVLDNVAYIVEP
jgi:Ca-activated chloride channel family protein